MTTKARVAALQWLYERGEVDLLDRAEGKPSWLMLRKMFNDSQFAEGPSLHLYSLTDKCRQDLHDATR